MQSYCGFSSLYCVIGRARLLRQLRETHLVELKLALLYTPRQCAPARVQALVPYTHALGALDRDVLATRYSLRAARRQRRHARVLKHEFRPLAREIQTPFARRHKPHLPARLLPVHENPAPLARLLVAFAHVYDLPLHARVEAPRVYGGFELVEGYPEPYVAQVLRGGRRDPESHVEGQKAEEEPEQERRENYTGRADARGLYGRELAVVAQLPEARRDAHEHGHRQREDQYVREKVECDFGPEAHGGGRGAEDFRELRRLLDQKDRGEHEERQREVREHRRQCIPV